MRVLLGGFVKMLDLYEKRQDAVKMYSPDRVYIFPFVEIFILRKIKKCLRK